VGPQRARDVEVQLQLVPGDGGSRRRLGEPTGLLARLAGADQQVDHLPPLGSQRREGHSGTDRLVVGVRRDVQYHLPVGHGAVAFHIATTSGSP
jgi:hypothetical protein